MSYRRYLLIKEGIVDGSRLSPAEKREFTLLDDEIQKKRRKARKRLERRVKEGRTYMKRN